jgi:hypothetical protein
MCVHAADVIVKARHAPLMLGYKFGSKLDKRSRGMPGSARRRACQIFCVVEVMR